MNDNELWIGRLKTTGKIIVFDPKTELFDATVEVFFPDRMELRIFNREHLRQNVEPVENESTILVAESAYRRWQRKNRKRHNLKPSPQRSHQTYEHNATHCYCGLRLTDTICPKCNWLKCGVGHCGCK